MEAYNYTNTSDRFDETMTQRLDQISAHLIQETFPCILNNRYFLVGFWLYDMHTLVVNYTSNTFTWTIYHTA